MPLPRIFSEIACVLTKKTGLSYAETEHQLGVSRVAVSKMINKRE
jgi:predicted transcriptional regulator